MPPDPELLKCPNSPLNVSTRLTHSTHLAGTRVSSFAWRLRCQAKLAAANGISCTTGTLCPAVVNRISDTLVSQLKTLTNNNAALSIIQTFQLDVALYISRTYNASAYNQQVVFLYEYHGQGVQTNQADAYLGYYASNFSAINGASTPAMGSPTCSWCVNGTSPGGWYDTVTAIQGGVEYIAPSISDLVRPSASWSGPGAGALMVSADWPKWLWGNFSKSGFKGFIGWCDDRLHLRCSLLGSAGRSGGSEESEGLGATKQQTPTARNPPYDTQNLQDYGAFGRHICLLPAGA